MKKTLFSLLIFLFISGPSVWGMVFHGVTEKDSIKIMDEDTVYTLLLAASQGDSALVLQLLKAGIRPDTTTWEGVTALMFAVNNGHPGTVKVLAENGANLNKKDQKGNSPLITAAQNGNLQIAEILIRNGADINTGDAYRVTPLMLAVGLDSFALSDMLVYYGADVSKADKNGTTALMVASVTGNIDIAYVLLEAGADVNCTDKQGLTPLHAATWYGYWSLASLLLDYGADPNIAADNGYTSLGVAVEADDLYATEMLASAGANLNQRISFSQNPLTIALKKKNDSIVSFLRANHARFNGWPTFYKYGFGTEINWNADDYRWSFFFLASEKKYNLNMMVGWGFRPSAIRVLENDSDAIDYQYWERRGNLFLAIDKSVFLMHGRNGFQAGVYGGLKGIYTYGSYRGTARKPNGKILAAPGIGLTLEGNGYRVTAGYEYLDLDLYEVSPHRINVTASFMWSSKKNNFKPNFINWF